MTVTITLRCDQPGCGASYDAPDSTLARTRIAASLEDWTSRRIWNKSKRELITEDYCSEHPREHQGGRPPAKLNAPPDRHECVTVPWPCRDNPLSDLLGHDHLGHRIANILTREGFTSREQLAATDEADLLDLRGLGLHAIVRIRHVLGEPSGL